MEASRYTCAWDAGYMLYMMDTPLGWSFILECAVLCLLG